ncbi:MAG: YybS family protein [Firmicutes bacterium]|nr:YybS family protein [Bacillota bacterium]
MTATGTRALVFGAFMAAVLVVLTALANLLALPVPFLLPLPVALAYLRYGSRYGALSGLVATAISFLFFGISTAVFLPLLTGLLPGLALGWGLTREQPPSRTVTVMTGAMLVGSVAGLLATLLVMGQNPIDLLARTLQESFSQALTLTERMVSSPNPQQQALLEGMRLMIADMPRVVRLALPSSLLGASAVLAIAAYQMAVWIFPRLGHRVPPLPPITHWSFPRWLIWLLAPVAVGMVLPQVPPAAREWLQSAYLTLTYALAIQGYFTANWFVRRRWPSRAVPWLLLFAVFSLQALGFLALVYIGIVDLALGTRQRSLQEEKTAPGAGG